MSMLLSASGAVLKPLSETPAHAVLRWTEFEGRQFLHITHENSASLPEFLRAGQSPNLSLRSDDGILVSEKPSFRCGVPQDTRSHLIIFGDSTERPAGHVRFHMKPANPHARIASSIIDNSQPVSYNRSVMKEDHPGYRTYSGAGPICRITGFEVANRSERQKGLGSCAIRYAVQLFGCELIEVFSGGGVVEFYKKCGFVDTGMFQDWEEAGRRPLMVFRNPAIPPKPYSIQSADFSKLSFSVLESGHTTSLQFRENLVQARQCWTRELDMSPESSLIEIAKKVAQKVTEEIRLGLERGASLQDLEFSVVEASRVGRDQFIQSKIFQKASLELFKESVNNPVYWEQRIVGEMRAILTGITTDKSIIQALRGLVSKDELSSHILGREGYRRVSEIFCRGMMFATHSLMRAACEAEGVDFKKLEWGRAFNGTTKQLKV